MLTLLMDIISRWVISMLLLTGAIPTVFIGVLLENHFHKGHRLAYIIAALMFVAAMLITTGGV